MEKEESELELFKEWLEPKLDSEETLKRYLNYAEKMNLANCACDVNCLKRVALSIRSASKWYRNAFYNWINMCYELGELSLEDKERLKSLARAKRKQQVSAGAPHVEVKREEVETITSSIRPYMLLLYYTGIRGTEAIEVKRRLEEVQCEDEICYLNLNWQRGHKKAFVVIFPKWLKEELQEAPPVSVHYLKKVGRKFGGLKTFRKYFYQNCIEVCQESVCDFLQGRVKTVSAKHYADLFDKAKVCYKKVLDKLEGRLTAESALIGLLRRALLAYLLSQADEVAELRLPSRILGYPTEDRRRPP